METPLVEPALQSDYDAIAELNVAAYGEFARHLQPDNWELMRQSVRRIDERAKIAQFFVCRDGPALVGAVAYCPAGQGNPEIFEPDMASVLLLAAHPNHRGKGIGKVLTATCVTLAQRDGANSIGLFTSELMGPAQRLYRSLGFQLDKELPQRLGIRYFRYSMRLSHA